MTHEEYLDYIDSLWREHISTNLEIPPTKWAKEFPEGKEMVAELYLEKTNQLEELRRQAKVHLDRLSTVDSDTRMWGETFVDIYYGNPARELKKQLNWLKRYLACFIADRTEITEEVIQRAREVPLSDLIPDLKLKSGKLVRCCPFHEEKTPSFVVFKENKYHCFGCGEHGNPIDYVMKTQNLIFLQAVKYLLKL